MVARTTPIEFPDTCYAISARGPAGTTAPVSAEIHLVVLRNAIARIRAQQAPYRDPTGRNLFGLAAMDHWIAQMQKVPFCTDCKDRSWSCARATALFHSSNARTMAGYLQGVAATMSDASRVRLLSAADHYSAFSDLLRPAITGNGADGARAPRYQDLMGDLTKQQAHAQILGACKNHLASAADDLEAALAASTAAR